MSYEMIALIALYLLGAIWMALADTLEGGQQSGLERLRNLAGAVCWPVVMACMCMMMLVEIVRGVTSKIPQR